MATRFDPKEYSRQRIITLCAKYLPRDLISINVGRKGFRLADSTVTLIEQSENIVAKAQELEEIIPDSTATIFRYGVALRNIFQNVEEYLTVSQLKSYSRRGRRKELGITEFDLKKVESALKRSPEPPVKTQKDEKIVKDAQKAYQNLLKEERYQLILEDVLIKLDLFVVDDSTGKKFFKTVNRLISRLKDKNQEKKQVSEKLETNHEEAKQLENQITEVEPRLPELRRKLEEFRQERGVFNVLEEKERLLASPLLSLFLKIVTNSLERYVKWVERREQRIVENKDAFMGMILEPSKFNGLDEELWREIVHIIENNGIDLLHNKDWFEFNKTEELRTFITRKDILQDFARLREIETQLDEIENQLQKDPQYLSVMDQLNDYDEQTMKLERLRQEISDMTEYTGILSQELTGVEEEVLKILD
ncbi:MAG: hypothetical protein ACFFE8_14655 [Candidatus Heimdallarchaeota archaeon]